MARQTWIEQPLDLGLVESGKGEFRAGVRGRETRRFAGSVRMVLARASLKTLRRVLHQREHQRCERGHLVDIKLLHVRVTKEVFWGCEYQVGF